MNIEEKSLHYHEAPRPGKLEVLPCKPCFSTDDLTVAYSPGVAAPCMEIKRDHQASERYTNRSNLVGVVSNGTAVLGLGNIGAYAAKPVMEGKSLLFKVYADVDAFDIELDISKPETFIEAVKYMEPTFGAINLEDIKAPECFYIEQRLREEMNIPVFHDDQHGTAVITGAALLNACEITGRRLRDIRCVVSGAGAAGIACAKFYMQLGVRRENIYMFDSKGILHIGRQDLHPTKALFAQYEECTMEQALKGADVFLGLSRRDILKREMVRSMAPQPIIFACANPDPEITYDEAKAARQDCIMGSGRSDWPNQVNNVSCFPYIFRAALDMGATRITESMKIAAAHALADLARLEVPAEVVAANGGVPLKFGPDYVIPKPFDPRMIEHLCPAIAEAAVAAGVATRPLRNKAEYVAELKARVCGAQGRIHSLVDSYGKEK